MNKVHTIINKIYTPNLFLTLAGVLVGCTNNSAQMRMRTQQSQAQVLEQQKTPAYHVENLKLPLDQLKNIGESLSKLQSEGKCSVSTEEDGQILAGNLNLLLELKEHIMKSTNKISDLIPLPTLPLGKVGKFFDYIGGIVKTQHDIYIREIDCQHQAQAGLFKLELDTWNKAKADEQKLLNSELQNIAKRNNENEISKWKIEEVKKELHDKNTTSPDKILSENFCPKLPLPNSTCPLLN